jgi:hypothetical protein
MRIYIGSDILIKKYIFTKRNQFYGGEFSSHNLTNLIQFADSIIAATYSTDVNEAAEQRSVQNKNLIRIDCNMHLGNYFKEICYKWPTCSLSASQQEEKEQKT